MSGPRGQGKDAFADLLCEVILLKWPIRWIARTLQTTPRMHNSEFIAATRMVGKCLALIPPIAPPLEDVRDIVERCMQAQLCGGPSAPLARKILANIAANVTSAPTQP